MAAVSAVAAEDLFAFWICLKGSVPIPGQLVRFVVQAAFRRETVETVVSVVFRPRRRRGVLPVRRRRRRREKRRDGRRIRGRSRKAA